MKAKFVPPNNPILTKVAKQIPKSQINSSETKEIVKIMLSVAHRQQKGKKKPILVGLAAPQIGILKRIILVDVKADGKGKVGKLRVYINPEITWASKKQAEWYEGCYSTGRVCGIVKRPVSIKIRAYILGFLPSQPPGLYMLEPKVSQGVATLPPPRWNSIEEKWSGYVARIFQHEINHLNGVRFPDLIKNPNHLHWVNKNEFKLYRNKQAWRNWPKKCTFEKWLRIKYPRVPT